MDMKIFTILCSKVFVIWTYVCYLCSSMLTKIYKRQGCDLRPHDYQENQVTMLESSKKVILSLLCLIVNRIHTTGKDGVYRLYVH